MEYQEEEEYLILNFKDPIEQKFFEKPGLFFKIANLESKTSFVQIGNHVFSAKYDQETIGTSLLFEEEKDPPPKNIYEQETNINLKYVGKTCKFLSLKWCNLPDMTNTLDQSEMVELEFKYPYAEVLRQLERGDLNINDVIKKPETITKNRDSPVSAHDISENKENDDEDEEDGDENDDHTLTSECNVTSAASAIPEIKEESNNENEKYLLLKDMIHKQQRDPEYYELVKDDIITSERDFLVLKHLYLKSFNYQKVVPRASRNNAWKYVDLQQSINDGIIESKEHLTEEDKMKLFSMENFDNFTSDLKIMVLSDYLKQEKKWMKDKSALELLEEDKYGLTVKKRYKMIKSLVKDLKYNMFSKKWYAGQQKNT